MTALLEAITALRAKAEAATPGPWDTGHNEKSARYTAHMPPPYPDMGFDACSIGTLGPTGRQIAIIPLDQSTRDNLRYLASLHPSVALALCEVAVAASGLVDPGACDCDGHHGHPDDPAVSGCERTEIHRICQARDRLAEALGAKP